MDKIKKGDPETQSEDLVGSNISKLKELFPEIVTEGKIDFTALQEILGEEVESGDEYYRFTWAGKAQARREAHKPSTGTLRPCKEESVDWDSTENLYIEGDNLEVLKILQKSYAGKVKMIYIDPPYNTGKDFVYKDNYKDNLKNYQEITGQLDNDGNKISTNTDSDGRYHSNWLNMMYPRLRLAKNLLSETGLIFVSINDNEVQNLKTIMSEVFGEDNFLSQFIWNSEGNTDNQLEVKINHEYVLCYLKNVNFKTLSVGRVIDPNTPSDSNLRKGYADNNINKNSPANPPAIIVLPVGFPCTEKELFYEAKVLDEDFFSISKKEKYISDSLKEKYQIENNSGLPVKLDQLVVKNFKLIKECRIYGGYANSSKLQQFIDNDCKSIIEDDNSPISFYLNRNAAVRYRKEVEKPRNILSVLRNFGTTEKSKTELKRMGVNFSYPKPTGLIEYLIQIGSEEDSIVLDFFSGSSSTAHAIMNLNVRTEMKRNFIQIQLPEYTDNKSEAFLAGYKTIAEIGKERIRRAANKIAEEHPEKAKDLDLGFKVFKLDTSNINAWDGSPEKLEQELFDSVSNIKTDRSEDDVLYEILLKYGLDLTLPIEIKELAGSKVYSVGYGALFICLADSITKDISEGIGAWKGTLNPEVCRVVFKDSGFKSDADKSNAVQTLKRFGITEIKSI